MYCRLRHLVSDDVTFLVISGDTKLENVEILGGTSGLMTAVQTFDYCVCTVRSVTANGVSLVGSDFTSYIAVYGGTLMLQDIAITGTSGNTGVVTYTHGPSKGF